jgi:predicted PurR-regulated permease PerM
VTRQRQATFWLAFLLAIGVLLWLLSSVLLPFVLGMAIAYLVDPLVGWLERHGVRRSIASGGIITLFFLAVGLVVLLVGPVMVEQVANLVQRLPALVGWFHDSLVPVVNRLLARMGARAGAFAPPSGAEMVQRGVGVVAGFATRLVSRGVAIVNLLTLLAITPLVAFYLVRDWPRVLGEIDAWLPRAHAETIREQARKIDHVLAGFARGSAMVCLFMAFYYAVALTITGLDFGLVIGLTAGAISFIPYIGAIVGFTSSVAVALVQFWPDWIHVAVVASVFVAGQIMQDYLLMPRLVGDQVGLHPLWVILGVLAGGALFGFVGVLLAVPACAVIGVLVRFAIAQYEESELYRGTPR